MRDSLNRWPANTPLTAQQIAARLLLEQEDALASLAGFVRYMKAHGCESRYFAFEPHPVQAPLIEAAEALVLGDLKALTVACPPAFSKSSIFSVWLPCWILAREPSARVIWVTHTQSLVAQFAQERRDILNSQAWRTLSGSSLRAAEMAADSLVTTHGGTLISRSAGASVTGLRGDYLLGDDLVSGVDEARSFPMLDSLAHWLRDDFLTRRDNANSRVALIGTRWSVRDPIGVLREMTEEGLLEAKHLRIAMVCDDPTMDPLGRAADEWIDWPGRFDDVQQRLQWQRNRFSWMTLYQGRPYDSAGGFADPTDVRVVVRAPIGTPVTGVDFAATDSTGADYSVVANGVVYVNDSGEKALCIVDLWRGQKNARDVSARVVDMVAAHRPYIMAVERDGSSRIYLDGVLPGEFRKSNVSMPYIKKLPVAGASKEVKASPLRGLIQRGLFSVVASHWLGDFLDELSRFPGGPHDDMVDAVACIARVFDSLSAATPEQPATRPEVLGFVVADEHGRPSHYRESLDDLFAEHERTGRYGRGRLP
jgi:phage terminase large subunit-like protein